MAVTPNSKILQTDMATLAGVANGKTDLSFGFLSPFTSGVKYMINPAIDTSNRGSGYKRGDYLQGVTDGTHSDLMIGANVESVDSSGGLLGIRIMAIYNFAPSATLPTSPADFTSIFGGASTSGTGAKIYFSTQTDVTRDYAFDDYDSTKGQVTGLVLLGGGLGYSASDVISIPGLTGCTVTVNTVDGSGTILTWTITTAAINTTIPSNIASMAASGGTGTGATFGGLYTYDIKPQWLTELNRLRNDLSSIGANINPNTSGKWPVSTLTTSLSLSTASDVEFYFQDTGGAVSVSVTGQIGDCWSEEFISDILSGTTSPPYSFLTFKIKIGGNSSCNISGKLRITVDDSGGSSSISAITSTLSAISTNPADWVKSGSGTATFTLTVPSTGVSPGEYTITISLTNGIFHNLWISALFAGGLSASVTSNTMINVPSIDNLKQGKKIICPETPSAGELPFGIFGKYAYTYPPATAIYEFFIQKITGVAGFNILVWRAGTIPSYTATTSGYYVGKTRMVSNVNPVYPAAMPWNLTRHFHSSPYTAYNPMLLGNDKVGAAAVTNSYDNSKIVEAQNEPPSWTASKWFSLGFVIIDSNGNLQKVTVAGTSDSTHPTWSQTLGGTTSEAPDTLQWTCVKVFRAADTWAAATAYSVGDTIIDNLGNTQIATVAGISGGSEPTWSVLLNGTTTDNTVTWKLTTIAPTIKPAVHRPYTGASLRLPRYPFYWYSETIAKLKPPTTSSATERTIWGAGNQWQRDTYHSPSFDSGWQQDNLAKGWWIYSVSLTRITGNQKNGINLPPASQVSVTLGCIRSGSFVSFGTWDTGQTISVLWPIFTSDALVYQCSERVDIQALAIGYGAAGVSLGTTANSFPTCAAFVSDTTTLLNLIS